MIIDKSVSMIEKKTIKAKDHISHNDTSYDFIPIACHYDKHTVITKNGELLQTIQIHGVFSQAVRDNIVNLRGIIRDTIKKNIKTDHFAFWIHTITRKTNLDDETPYPDILSANIHNIWRDKNYWHDKFVNTLYISIIYHKPELNISTFNAFMNSLSPDILNKYYEDVFRKMALDLNHTVENILDDLKDFGVHRLGIIDYQQDDLNSEIVFLFRSIINLNESMMPIPLSDYSFSLSTHDYIVGNNQIQVLGKGGLTFASMLSIKEYHEIAAESMEDLMRLPIEFIATEVFYFIPKKDSIKELLYPEYILGVSGNKNIADNSGITDMISGDDRKTHFCNHQINIMIINSDKNELESNVKTISKDLSARGIMHIMEDINLEQTFWSQLPGNFSFLRRVSPILSENIASFASLHNFPAGNSTNPWGKAITILRTENGSPYFMNLHDTRNIGHGCIFSFYKSGKTVLLNFLISEAMKFMPTMVYLSTNQKSKIFLDAIESPYKDYDIKNITSGRNVSFDFSEAKDDDLHKSIDQIIDYLSNMKDKKPKILVIDNITNILKHKDFVTQLPIWFTALTANNAIMLFSIDLDEYSKMKNIAEIQTILNEHLGSLMILPGVNKGKIDVGNCLNLTQAEKTKLESFNLLSRLFLMKQNNRTMVLELSLGGLPGIVKILSASAKDLEIYKKVKSEKEQENWIIDLYNIFRNSRS